MSEIVNKTVPVAKCKPHPENYNRHEESQIEDLRLSLREFGQVRSIVVQDAGDATFLLVAGHGVHEAARRETLESLKADVIPQDWGPERVLAYLAADNELARHGTPDEAQLATIVARIEAEASAELARLAAGGEDRLKELLAQAQANEPPDDPGPQVDRAEELQEKWQVERGQVWQIGRHRLICGDSTDGDTVDAVLDGAVVDLGLTSPPYAVGKEYEADVSFAEHLAMLRGFADQALRVIKPGGFLFTNFDEIAPQSHTRPLTESDRQCLYPISKDYWQIFHIEREMDLYAMRIWYKPFNRLKQPFWTYHTSIPHYQEWEHIWTWRLPGGDGDQVYDWDISRQAIWDTRKDATDDKPLTRHVAAFPVGIPERAIRAHSSEGATVWEPFGGSGTTIAACERLGRDCRAIELSPEYCAVTLERLTGMGLEATLLSDDD